MKDVLAKIIQDMGKTDVYNNMKIELLKETITKRIGEYTKKGGTPAEKGLALRFCNKVNHMNDKDKIIMYVSETMFNLSGMNA